MKPHQECEFRKKMILLLVCVIGVYLVFRYLLPLFVPLILAGIVTVFYYPVVHRMYGIFGLKNVGSKNIFLMVMVGLFYIVAALILGGLFCYGVRQGQNVLLNLPFYQAKGMAFLGDCCCRLDTVFQMREGSCYSALQTIWKNDLSGMGQILPKVTGYSVGFLKRFFSVGFGVVIMVIATFFMAQEYDRIREMLRGHAIGRQLCKAVVKCKQTGITYIKTQIVILLADGLVCIAMFWLMRRPCFFALGIAIAVMDALPVLGAGMVLIPYALFWLIQGNIGNVLLSLLTYTICVGIRQVTEPRMIGKQIGLAPLYTLTSMYVGVRLFGVMGFALGPLGVLLIRKMYEIALNTCGLCKIKL